MPGHTGGLHPARFITVETRYHPTPSRGRHGSSWRRRCLPRYLTAFPVTKIVFIKETDTFGHIVVLAIYTSHIDHFSPQHTAFGQSVACFSVFFVAKGIRLLDRKHFLFIQEKNHASKSF